MPEKQDSGKNLTRAAQEYLEAHCASRFSLQEMAGALFINGSYLLRTFKRITGTTPLNYHHQLRCSKAKELLVQTDRAVSDIGEMVGFVSSSHFSHVFRKMEGCTPSEYRMRNKTVGRKESESLL